MCTRETVLIEPHKQHPESALPHSVTTGPVQQQVPSPAAATAAAAASSGCAGSTAARRSAAFPLIFANSSRSTRSRSTQLRSRMSKLLAAAAGGCCHPASGAAVAGPAGGLWAGSACRAPWLGSKLSAPDVLGCSVQSVVPEGVAVPSCACWCSSAAAAACFDCCLLPALSCSMDKRTYGITERFKRLTLVSCVMLRFGQTSWFMHGRLQQHVGALMTVADHLSTG